MTLHSGKDLIRTAWQGGYAIPAFNVSNMETAQAVVSAAEDRAAPVFLQVSPGAIAYAGYATLTRLALDIGAAARVPVVVHLDHARELDVVLRAIDDGYGSVMFDGSRLALEDNIASTERVVAHAAARGTCVEGEIGRIGARRTRPRRGAHRRRRRRRPPTSWAGPGWTSWRRPWEPSMGCRTTACRSTSSTSGRSRRRATSRSPSTAVRRRPRDAPGGHRAGIAKVNISSRVTRALAGGIREAWAKDPDELDLRRFMASGRDAVRWVAAGYFDLVGATGRAAVAARARGCRHRPGAGAGRRGEAGRSNERPHPRPQSRAEERPGRHLRGRRRAPRDRYRPIATRLGEGIVEQEPEDWWTYGLEVMDEVLADRRSRPGSGGSPSRRRPGAWSRSMPTSTSSVPRS